MNKYQKAMERLCMDAGMYDRILLKIRRAQTAKKKKWMLTLGGAAAIIFLAIRLWTPTSPPPAETAETTEDLVFEMQMDSSSDSSISKYASAEELSQAVGFEVEEFTDLPFDAEEILYQADTKNTAEIIYSSSQRSLYYRKAAGSVNLSLDSSDYERRKKIQTNDATVTLNGDSQAFYLAFWSDENYAYAIEDSEGLSENILLDLVHQICNAT